MVSKEKLKHISNLSKLELSEEEFDIYANQINRIIEYLDKLDSISLDDYEFVKISKKYTELREDKVQPFTGSLNNVIKNKKNDFVKGPRMM
ncbi:MAG: Asp-tRNA(Asn)/Glu-tRNA(Gln) amidotransferase subunit GatC [Nitrososphaeraceae archaeon]